MGLAHNHEQILAFLYELHDAQEYFPLHVLQLLKKHFGYRFSYFLPRYSFRQQFPIDHPYTQPHFVRAVSVGMQRELLRRYFSGPHKSGVFSPHNRTPELYARPVLMVEDVVPLADYQKTAAYAEITSGGLGLPMLLQLNADGMQLGSITLMRRYKDPPFSDEDRRLAETICPYITQAYKAHVEKARLEKELDFAHQYHMSLDDGSIILDNSFLVVRCNTRAAAYCGDILARFYKENNLHERGYAYWRGDGDIADAQSFATRLQKRLLEAADKPVAIQSTGLEQRYLSTVKTLSIGDASGVIDIYYVVLMKAQAVAVLNMDVCLHYGLTPREIQLATFIVQGLTNQQISEQLFISPHTTKTHITKLFAKTGATKRAELVYKLKHPATGG